MRHVQVTARLKPFDFGNEQAGRQFSMYDQKEIIFRHGKHPTPLPVSTTAALY